MKTSDLSRYHSEVNQLTGDAKRNVMQKFAKGNIHATGNIGKRARLAYFASGVHGTGKPSMKSGGDRTRTAGERLYQVG